MSDLKPLVIYGRGPGPNPWKVVFVLAELGLPYKWMDVQMADMKKEPFISLNPNGRVPVLTDPNNQDIALFESGAIIDYLIEIYDTNASLTWTTSPEKHLVRCWEHFQMSGQGPYFGQKSWFTKFHPEYLPSAVERYENEIKRVIGVIDTHLEKQGTDYLVGNKLTYADIMFLPYFGLLNRIYPELDTTQWKTYTAWIERICARPAIVKVMDDMKGEMEKAYPSAK